MKKIIVIFVITISSMVLVGCSLNNDKHSIEIGKEQSIEQLVPIKIKGTNDSIIITSKVKWEVPKTKNAITPSFSISIPYTITVDNKKYKGIYALNNPSWSETDNNPKYNFKVTNLTKNGDMTILITKK